MTHRVIQENVDIYQMPKDCFGAHANTQITIGDLHGNAMKLMFMLVKQGIVSNMTEESYARLVAIYLKSPLIKQDIEDFNQIISGLQLKNKTALRLIGDELGDRGSNDYFTLKILKRLHDEQVPVEHIISNHCAEFVQACEDYPEKRHFHAPMMMFGHAKSLENLNALVEQGLVSSTEVIELANTVVKPKLKAISYDLNADNSAITLFSHAGIGLNVIEGLAKLFHVPYQDATALDLAKTIDGINQRFQEHVKQKTVDQLFPPDAMHDGYGDGRADLRADPMVCAIWNRRYDLIDRPAVKHSYRIAYAHGHDGSDPLQLQDNVYNLDMENNLGKTPYSNKGEYRVLHHTKPPKVEARNISEAAVDSQRQRLLLGPTMMTRNAYVNDFQIQLIALCQKERALRRNGHLESADAAKTMTETITQSYEQNFRTNVGRFQEECNAAIATARPQLETHRGWKRVLSYLLLIISVVGIYPVIADIQHKKATGKHLPFFQTDSAKKMDDIEKTVERAPHQPPASA